MEALIDIGNARKSLTQRLQAHTDSAQIDADCLLCFVLGKTRAWLYAYEESVLSEEQQLELEALVARRMAGEPIAYLIGTQEFWSLNFIVNSHVLIPRPATECLVEEALNIIPKNQSFDILELGTGSGIIAITLAIQRPNTHIVATDIDSDALDVAKHNAKNHNVSSIELVLSDWYQSVPTKAYDLIISNPPYIDEDDLELEGDVKKYQPRTALISSGNGLDAIITIVRNAHQYLRSGGYLMLEHGWKQHQSVKEILVDAGFETINCQKDLSGAERVTTARKPH